MSRDDPVKTTLVAGCAGFIGARTCEMLLDAGHIVIGIDNLNDAYDVRLKQWRLARLTAREDSPSNTWISPTGPRSRVGISDVRRRTAGH